MQKGKTVLFQAMKTSLPRKRKLALKTRLGVPEDSLDDVQNIFFPLQEFEPRTAQSTAYSLNRLSYRGCQYHTALQRNRGEAVERIDLSLEWGQVAASVNMAMHLKFPHREGNFSLISFSRMIPKHRVNETVYNLLM